MGNPGFEALHNAIDPRAQITRTFLAEALAAHSDKPLGLGDLVVLVARALERIELAEPRK